jgi:methylglutaconyl-CoA hydratase
VRSEQRPAPHVGHIQILSLDRPDARNAISRRLLADLRAEVDALRCSPTGLRALVLASGIDGVFCAGADLKERATFSLDE